MKNEIIDLTIDDMDVDTHEDEMGTNYEKEDNTRDIKISAANNISNSTNKDKTINDTSVVNTNNKTKVKIEIEDDMERHASQHCADKISKNNKPKHEEIYAKNETPQLQDSEINTKQYKIKDTPNTKQNTCAEKNSKDDTVRDNVTSVTNHITPTYDYTHGRTTTLKTYTSKRNNNSDSVKLEPIDNDIEGQLLPNADQDLCQDLLVKAEVIYIKQEVTDIDDNETQIEHLYVNNDIINGAQVTCKNNLKYHNCDTKIPVTTLLKCHKFDFNTNKQSSFSIHMENAHYDYNSTYLCDYCDYNSDKTNLKLHMSIMHENKVVTYSCDYCDYTNSSKHNLKSHLCLKHDFIDVLNSKVDMFPIMTSTIVTLDTNESTTRAESSKNTNKTKAQTSNAIKIPNETQTSVKEKTSQHSATCDSFITSYNVHGCNNTIAAVTNSQTTPKLEEIDYDIEGQLLLNKHEDLTNLVVKNEEIDIKQEVTEVDYNETQEMEHSLINKDIIQSKRENNVQYHNRASAVTTLHKCHKCDYSSKFKIGLTTHLDTKHNDGRVTYFCSQCDYTNISKYYLKKHENKQHYGKTHFCDKCDFKCDKKGSLTVHIEKKHNSGEVTYSCDLCDYSTTSHNYFKIHKRTKHNNVIYTCDNCDYKSFDKRNVDKHKESKHNDYSVTYFCDQCDYVSTKKNSLKSHKYLKHEGKIHSCDKCYYTTRDTSNLKSHIESNHNNGVTYSCDQCDYTTFIKYNLKNHKLAKHDRIMHYCDNCDYKSVHKTNLTKHKENRHNDGSHTYSCDQCDYTSLNKCNLLKHKKSRHNVSSVTYFCNACDYKTCYKRNLIKHKHSKHDDNIVTYPCDQCDHVSISKYYLKSHKLINHEGLIHSCDKCDYTSVDKSNLTKHMDIKHNDGTVTYSCDLCDFTHTSKTYLNSHKYAQHGNRKGNIN